jgi:hypothetical protein
MPPVGDIINSGTITDHAFWSAKYMATHSKHAQRIPQLSILSALQPWVSLGLLNNQSQLLSISRLLHPLLYLHYFQVCYIFPGINNVLTFQVAIIKSDFQTSCVDVCFSSFRGWLLGFGTNYFYGVGFSPTPNPQPGGPGYINGSNPFYLPRIMSQTGLKADVTYLTLSGYVPHYIPK